MAPRSNEVGRSLALAALLGRIEPALGSGVGSESPLVARLRLLRRRLEHEHLQIAVLGQFKRGKSTFINALLGADILAYRGHSPDGCRYIHCPGVARRSSSFTLGTKRQTRSLPFTRPTKSATSCFVSSPRRPIQKTGLASSGLTCFIRLTSSPTGR